MLAFDAHPLLGAGVYPVRIAPDGERYGFKALSELLTKLGARTEDG